MQLHLQAVRIYQVDAKARSSDMTSKHNVTLADQTWGKKKRKEKTQKWHITKEHLTTAAVDVQVGVICEED